jgi:hypothetical protein
MTPLEGDPGGFRLVVEGDNDGSRANRCDPPDWMPVPDEAIA